MVAGGRGTVAGGRGMAQPTSPLPLLVITFLGEGGLGTSEST